MRPGLPPHPDAVACVAVRAVLDGEPVDDDVVRCDPRAIQVAYDRLLPDAAPSVHAALRTQEGEGLVDFQRDRGRFGIGPGTNPDRLEGARRVYGILDRRVSRREGVVAIGGTGESIVIYHQVHRLAELG